jgi:hypothetical protein
VLTFSVVLVLYAGMEALGANGLIAVLGFGLTLSNFPGVDPRASPSPSAELVGSQHALLTFHSELAFLVRTFFFVLIGAVAQLGIFSRRTLLMAGTVAALFLARWLAVQASRWSWKGIGAHGRDVILWMLPRGLITIVLAIEVARVRGSEVSFLPGLAFAVILATNLMVVVGSVLTARSATAEAGVEAPVVADDKTPTDARCNQRNALAAGSWTRRCWYCSRSAGSFCGTATSRQSFVQKVWRNGFFSTCNGEIEDCWVAQAFPFCRRADFRALGVPILRALFAKGGRHAVGTGVGQQGRFAQLGSDELPGSLYAALPPTLAKNARVGHPQLESPRQ